MGVGVGARAASTAAMTAIIVSNGQSHGRDQQMSYNDHDARIMFIFFLCVLAIVLVLAIIRFNVSYLIRRRRRQQATTNLLPVSGQTPTTGLDPVAIAALPTLAYRAGQAAPAECAVCLSVVEEGEVVRVLPNCRHVFHVGCIDMWLHSHTTCPLCRADAVAKEAGEASASKSTPELLSGGASLGPALDGTSGTKECGSSRCGLGSSFRRMLSWELPGRTRRVQADGVVDLERQQ